MPQPKKTASYVILHYEIPALHCCGGLNALADLIDAELKPAEPPLASAEVSRPAR